MADESCKQFIKDELKFSLAIRNRLTKHAHSLYFKGITFYQVSNIDNRVNNADQLLTQDIERFSETLAHLYSGKFDFLFL